MPPVAAEANPVMPHKNPTLTMRGFSRSMPMLESERWTTGAKLAIGGIGVAAIAFAVAFPPVAAGLAGLYALAELSIRRHLNRMRDTRTGESICTFARTFNRRSVDPWVVRAVWDEMQDYIGSGNKDFPLRATDRIEEDLKIADTEEIASRVARRTGRSMENTSSNPLYESVTTVGDMVHFLNSQALADAA